jgi:hypothetical protein
VLVVKFQGMLAWLLYQICDRTTECQLTDSSIVEHNQGVDIIYPLDPETSLFMLPCTENGLNVSSFESVMIQRESREHLYAGFTKDLLGGKVGEVENTSDSSGHRCRRRGRQDSSVR